MEKFAIGLFAFLAIMFAFGYFRMKDRYETLLDVSNEREAFQKRGLDSLLESLGEVRSKVTNLLKICDTNGICIQCGRHYSHDIVAPFASCGCHTTEWGEGLSPYMLLEKKVFELRRYADILGAEHDAPNHQQIIEAISKDGMSCVWRKRRTEDDSVVFYPVIMFNGLPFGPALFEDCYYSDVPEQYRNDIDFEPEKDLGPTGPSMGQGCEGQSGRTASIPGAPGLAGYDSKYVGDSGPGPLGDPGKTHEDNAKSFFETTETRQSNSYVETAAPTASSPSPSPDYSSSSSSSGGSSGCD